MKKPTTTELDRAIAAALPFVQKQPKDIEAALAIMERMLRVKAGPERLEAARDGFRDALLSPIVTSLDGLLSAFGCAIIMDPSRPELALALL